MVLITRRISLLPALAAFSFGVAHTSAFTTTLSNVHHRVQQITTTSRQTPTQLFYKNEENNSNSDQDNEVFDLDTLEDRIGKLRLKIMEEDLLRPPNANLCPKDFVTAVLEGIFYNEDPRPDAGFMLLLRCSTDKWSEAILKSIGAPADANLETVASALGTAIGRPHNQYSILVGGSLEEDDENNKTLLDENGERNFYVNFPGDTLDFLDGTAYVNVEFRSKDDNSLLVLTGWQLSQRPDGAWLVDQIDWQDYREEYWPGVGRENWMPFEGRKR